MLLTVDTYFHLCPLVTAAFHAASSAYVAFGRIILTSDRVSHCLAEALKLSKSISFSVVSLPFVYISKPLPYRPFVR